MTIENEARTNVMLADQLSYKETLPKGFKGMINDLDFISNPTWAK